MKLFKWKGLVGLCGCEILFCLCLVCIFVGEVVFFMIVCDCKVNCMFKVLCFGYCDWMKYILYGIEGNGIGI